MKEKYEDDLQERRAGGVEKYRMEGKWEKMWGMKDNKHGWRE